MDDMAAMARRHQPGLIIADRTVGGPHENILTPEQRVPDKPLDHPWESCITMGNGWAYRPNDTYKSTRELIHLLVDIVAKGGNLLLNIGPGPDGRFDAAPLQRLHDIGAWMTVNKEAIHGTRPVPPYKEGQTCFTRKGGTVYAIVLAENDEDAPPRTVEWTGQPPVDGSVVRMLGLPDPVTWHRDGDRTIVEIPTSALPCEHAWVLSLCASTDQSSGQE